MALVAPVEPASPPPAVVPWPAGLTASATAAWWRRTEAAGGPAWIRHQGVPTCSAPLPRAPGPGRRPAGTRTAGRAGTRVVPGPDGVVVLGALVERPVVVLSAGVVAT